MKRIIFFLISIGTIVNSMTSQVDFGANGSFWNYTYHSHNGNGGGWEVFYIEGDTVINNEPLKILRKDYYSYSAMPFEEYYGSSLVGFMKITDDSVFVNDNLILDFSMQIEDSLILHPELVATIQLAIDSIGYEEINGYEYKKWFGQKICISGDDSYPYEEFTIVENVGQVGFDYLLWNSDGCLIGGGLRSFDCHGNGDFTYPPNLPCNRYMIVTVEEIEFFNGIRVYPNPAKDILNIKSEVFEPQLISIFDYAGRKILKEKCNSNLCSINIEALTAGIYFIEIDTEDGKYIKKIIKK